MLKIWKCTWFWYIYHSKDSMLSPSSLSFSLSIQLYEDKFAKSVEWNLLCGIIIFRISYPFSDAIVQFIMQHKHYYILYTHYTDIETLTEWIGYFCNYISNYISIFPFPLWFIRFVWFFWKLHKFIDIL